MGLWSINGIDDGLTGRSVASLDFAPDFGIFRPTLAVNGGGVYGKGVQDGFVAGPEIRFDLAPMGGFNIGIMAAYDYQFRNAGWDEGILWAGLEFVGKVTILVSVAIFPITVNTYSGIRDVRGSMLEIGRAYGATEWQIFWKIILPAAVPFIMAGIRLAVGLAIIGIIVAEFFTAISGLGGMIVEYANVFATAKLFVPIIVIAIVGVVLTELVMWLERRMSRWRQLERERF